MIDQLVNLIIVMAIVMLLFSMTLLVRNFAVYDYRTDILHQVSKKAKEDISAGRDWSWRYDMLDEVEYGDMVIKFWKPLKSFYDLDRLLK